MILKYKTIREDGDAIYDIWNYIDGITDCSVFFSNEPDVKCICIEFGKDQSHKILALHDEAYLINDCGKTIEKIAY